MIHGVVGMTRLAGNQRGLRQGSFGEYRDARQQNNKEKSLAHGDRHLSVYGERDVKLRG